MPERGSFIGKVKEIGSTVGEVFQTREGALAAEKERKAKLDALGGLEHAARTMPLHEIEEALGLDEAPFVDRRGNEYPSLAEIRREREKNRQIVDRFLAGPTEPVTLFQRAQNVFKRSK